MHRREASNAASSNQVVMRMATFSWAHGTIHSISRKSEKWARIPETHSNETTRRDATGVPTLHLSSPLDIAERLRSAQALQKAPGRFVTPYFSTPLVAWSAL